MPFLLTMSLFGIFGMLFYIILLPLAKRYLSIKWRRVYLIINILEYLLPFPYCNAVYGDFLRMLFVEGLSPESVDVSLYRDKTMGFVQITTNGIQIPNVVMYLLIAGIVIVGLVLLYWQICRYRKMNHFLRDDAKEITDKEYNRIIQECTSGYERVKRIRFYKCKEIDTPFTIGIIRSIIVLPDIEWEKSNLMFAIKHEVTHIKHRDNLIKILSLCVLALNFYNPLAYFLLHEWNKVAEMSCDASVTVGMTEDEVTQYGFLIIEMAENQTDNESIPIMGLNMQDKIMKERILQMKKGTKKESLFRKLVGASVMGVVLFTSSLTVFAYSPKKVMLADEVASEIFFYEGNATSWEYTGSELSVDETVSWTFISEDGEIIESIDESDIGAETHVLCFHDYVSGELVKHYKYSDGSCKVEIFDAQDCRKCGNTIIGDLKTTATFNPCIH